MADFDNVFDSVRESVVTPPVLQALVLADQIYTDAHTGKKVIAGTFNRLQARKFPSQLGRTVYAFICLTDVQGSVDIRLRYVDLQTSEVLLENAPIPVASNDPLASVEMIVEVPSFPMPHAGVYAFELYTGNEMLGSLRIAVAKLNEEKQK